jgi:hypothetical protein
LPFDVHVFKFLDAKLELGRISPGLSSFIEEEMGIGMVRDRGNMRIIGGYE